MTASAKLMGAEFSNPVSVSLLAWAVGLLIMAINLSAIYDFALQHLPALAIAYLLFVLAVAAYIGFVCYLALGPDRCRLSLTHTSVELQ